MHNVNLVVSRSFQRHAQFRGVVLDLQLPCLGDLEVVELLVVIAGRQHQWFALLDAVDAQTLLGQHLGPDGARVAHRENLAPVAVQQGREARGHLQLLPGRELQLLGVDVGRDAPLRPVFH